MKVRRETGGRRGKAVTTVADVPLDDAGLKELAGRLKKRCGVGGAVKDGVIELQGDHRDVVVEVLRADGYDAVLARRLAHAEQVDDEDERLVGADDAAGAALAVGQVRRDRDAPPAADLHAGHALVPARR